MAKIRINGCGWWDKGRQPMEGIQKKKALRFTTQHLEKENSKMRNTLSACMAKFIHRRQPSGYSQCRPHRQEHEDSYTGISSLSGYARYKRFL